MTYLNNLIHTTPFEGALTVSGLSLIAASGVLQTRGVSESAAKKACRWGVAVVGLGMTCYGVYHLAQRIFEQRSVLLVDSPAGQQTQNLAAGPCPVRLEQAKKEFLSCPQAKKLWNEVKSKGAFTIKCVPSKDAPFGARVDLVIREISISEKSENMVENLSMELSNLKRADKFIRNVMEACKGPVDEYVRQAETTEYGSLFESLHLHNGCRDGGFWKVGKSQFHEQFTGEKINNWSTVEGYLATQEEVGHSDLLRERWYRLCNPAGLPKFQQGLLGKRDEL